MSDRTHVEASGVEPAHAFEARRRAVVLTADLVGYSELMFRDARGGIGALVATRAILIEAVSRQGGRVVSTPGDFLLAVFDRALAAVSAAVSAQTGLAARNRGLGAGQGVSWRMGIAHGDIFEIGGDVYGHAVNVAARIQALGRPGDILVEGEIEEELRTLVGFPTENLGTQRLKNIGQAVTVYRLQWPGLEEVAAQPDPAVSPELLKRLTKPTLKIEPFEVLERTERKALFARAIEDEIHLVLSRLSSSISVVDRDNTGGGTQIDYYLKGSLQSAGRHLRLMARLVSAASGASIWAERYECDLRQGFQVQDDMAREIVVALQLALTEGEQARFWRRGTTSGLAWEQFQVGRDYEGRYTRHGHAEAKQRYLEAVRLDPTYLSALVALGFCHLDEVRLGWSDDPAASLTAAEAALADASRIGAAHPDVLSLLAFVRQVQGREAEAKEAMDRAVAAAGQNSEIVAYQGALYDLMGNFTAAIRCYSRALSLTPHAKPWIGANLGLSHLAVGRAAEAERIYQNVIEHYPNYVRAWIGLAVALVRRDRAPEARLAAARVLELEPGFSAASWGRSRPFSSDSVLAEFMADMRAAGLPP